MADPKPEDKKEQAPKPPEQVPPESPPTQKKSCLNGWTKKKESAKSEIIVTYPQRATTGSEPDAIVNHSLKKFYKFMAWAGGAALLVDFILLGYWLAGGFACRTCYQNVPATTVTAPARTAESSNTGIERLTSAVEKLAEAKKVPVVETRTTPPEQPKVIIREEAKVVKETIPPTDAERRNKALEKRLRQKYGIE